MNDNIKPNRAYYSEAEGYVCSCLASDPDEKLCWICLSQRKDEELAELE